MEGTMKRTFIKMLSVVMALVMLSSVFGSFAVVAADAGNGNDQANEEAEHEHVWGDIIVDDITCDEEGKIIDGAIYRECTVDGCDEKKDELNGLTLIEAIKDILGVDCRAHGAYVYTIVTKPTCGTDGVATYTCPVCDAGFGKGETKIPVKKLGHDTTTVVTKEENCYEDGIKVTTCSRCDYNVSEVINKFNGHDFVDIDVTKLATGNCTGECVLGIPANKSVYEASTCCTNGYKYQHCSRCDILSNEVPLPLEEHTWEKATFTKTSSQTKFEIYVWDDGVKTKAGDYTLAEVRDNFIVTAASANSVTIVKEYVEGDVACATSQLRYKKCEDCGWKVQIDKDCDLAHGHKWESKTTTKVEGVARDKGWVETKPNCIK
jgi:hypothetical protein